ncbi:MAG: hypothetical protein HND47_22730 [Chloroflexi bacterium]|nr:hypothetical protein [Chloroflexota bacterium]
MKPVLHFLVKYKPAVRKVWLQLLAGLVWLGVGVMLNGFASRWLKVEGMPTRILLILAGLSLAMGIYAFGFSRLASKNIRRIAALAGEKVCLFAFQAWTSYPLVAFMILLGVYLRVYSPFPKPMLAVLYIGIGSALFAASLHYFIHVMRASEARA